MGLWISQKKQVPKEGEGFAKSKVSEELWGGRKRSRGEPANSKVKEKGESGQVMAVRICHVKKRSTGGGREVTRRRDENLERVGENVNGQNQFTTWFPRGGRCQKDRRWEVGNAVGKKSLRGLRPCGERKNIAEQKKGGGAHGKRKRAGANGEAGKKKVAGNN